MFIKPIYFKEILLIVMTTSVNLHVKLRHLMSLIFFLFIDKYTVFKKKYI